jgi:hypothetical protein
MFVGLTHQPTTISGLAYMVAVAPYVRQERTSVLKPMDVIRNMNVGPDEYKKIAERMPFSCTE